MNTTTLASKPAAERPITLLASAAAVLRDFYAHTPLSIFMNAVSTMHGVPGARPVQPPRGGR